MRLQYSAVELSGIDAQRLLFSEYMELWLANIKLHISPSTYESYCQIVRQKIVPYFEKLDISLIALKAIHIEMFYQTQYELALSPNTVLRYHAVLHKALNDARRKELIVISPAVFAQRPPKQKYITEPYSAKEIHRLFQVIDGHKLELIIKLAAFYGFRRSEVLGLRWKSISFETSTITVNHTFQRICNDEGIYDVFRDKVKRDASFRTLPMPDGIRNMIMDYRTERYSKELPLPDAYLFLGRNGNVIKPDYVSSAFHQILKENGLRHIRFHDLRHSSAGILISNRVPLIEVQQWLGHSTINTTADLYAHLDYVVKERSACVMNKQLFETEENNDEV